MPELIITDGKLAFAPLAERHRPGIHPDEPIPYTLTPQAEAYLDGLPAEPEPEAGL